MAKVRLPNGIEIDDLSASEAMEIAQKVMRDVPRPAEPVAVRVRAPRIREVNGYFDTASTTLRLLEEIKAAGSNGLPAERVQEIVHADTGKGIGGRMVRINGYLRRLGFADTNVLFDNPKNRKTGKRVWKPKVDLDDAIDAARKAVKN